MGGLALGWDQARALSHLLQPKLRTQNSRCSDAPCLRSSVAPQFRRSTIPSVRIVAGARVSDTNSKELLISDSVSPDEFDRVDAGRGIW